ncbi:MAG TPA: diguanylate cyclase, partial [Nitrospiria bacterium]|nr:diguanylate cyclase [Nitrospiria bacterium]
MFNDVELKTLQGVGHQVAIALERARLVEHLEQTVDARTVALRESERWFRAIFNSQLNAVLVMSPDRRILDANPEAERMFGYSLAEMKDRYSEMLHVDREHYLRIGERIREPFEKGEVVRFEIDFRRKNGQVFPAEKTISLLRNDSGEPIGIIGTVRDLTERKRSEEERSRLISILETTTDFVGIGDVEGRAQYLNGAGRRMVGLGPDENVLGTLIQEFHPEWAQRLIFEEGLPSAARDGVWSGETALLRRDGRSIPISQVILAHKAPDGTVEYFSTIARDISESKQTEEKIRCLAYYDSVTDLPNRTLLYERLEEMIADGRRQGSSAALLIMDIDRFKEINDTLGHDRGDLLLKELGRRLRAVVWEPDLISRLGGDEFAILFPRLARTEDVHLVVLKVIRALEEPFLVEGLPIVVEASIGIALFPDHGANPSSLLRGADVAMYAAKESGSGYLVYDSKYDRHSPRRLSLLGELRRAIDGDQLLLQYQPKINLRTRRVVGVEALVRWQHPTHGLIPPDEFIPPAEKSGLIGPLTRWVLNAALRQCGA